MLLDVLLTARDLGRLHEIASVFVRHGLGDMVRRLGIAAALQRAGRAILLRGPLPPRTHKSSAQHLREALEELGPAFVKAGQMLADRHDLLPPEWTEELARLREQAAPADPEAVRRQLAEDLGPEPHDLIAGFDAEPIAAASIAQVHRARLRTGETVALKVRRPGIKETVEADLRLLARIAELAEQELVELRRIRPRQLVRQLARSLHTELDLRCEARHAQRLTEILAEHDALVIPRFVPELSSERLCAMELFEGPSLAEWLEGGGGAPAQRKSLAAVGADAVLEMVLGAGFFHADPHLGNFILLADGRLGILDFGMVGRLTESRRHELLELLIAVMDERPEQVVDVLLDWAPGREADLEAFEQDCAYFLDRYRDIPLHELDITALLADLAALVRDNDLKLPPDVVQLLKVLVTLDHLGRALDPEFLLAARAEPYVRRQMRSRSSTFGALRRSIRDSRGLLAALPRHARRVLRQLRRGRVALDVDLKRLDAFGQRLDRIANRVAVALITAALIVGTSIAMTVPGGPTLLWLPAFGLLGFLTAIGAGLWVLWSIARSGRR